MQRWLLITNCQAFGLANCLKLLNPEIEPLILPLGRFREETETCCGGFGDYDRVIVSHEAMTVPGADFVHARRVTRFEPISFSAYHPDLTYLFVDGAPVRGPLDAYQSMIAYVAHRRGLGIEDTLSLYRERFFAACGHLDRWVPERERLVADLRSQGYDIAAAIRRWGRHGAFMYSTNHPRIHVLRDLARIYLETEGFAADETGVLPHDNLVQGPCFPVYPEVGDQLGVPGSYRFKIQPDYRELDLREFVAASFAAFDGIAGRPVTIEAAMQPVHDRVAQVLEGAAW